MPDTIEAYAAVLYAALPGSRSSRRRVVEEVQMHLSDIAAEHARLGDDRPEAAATALLGSPRQMAAGFEPERTGWRRITLTGLLSSLVILLSLVAVLSDSTPSLAMHLPTRQWAMSCTREWNRPANFADRQVVAAGGPFRILPSSWESSPVRPWAQRPLVSAGRPVSVYFTHQDFSRLQRSCLLTLVFRGRHGRRYLQIDLGHPHRAFDVAGDSRRQAPHTRVRADGSLSSRVRPSSAAGTWGQAPGVSINFVPKMEPTETIDSARTCFRYRIRVDEPADVTVMHTTLHIPVQRASVLGGARLFTECLAWRGHQSDPGRLFLDYPRLQMRELRVVARSTHGAGETVREFTIWFMLSWQRSAGHHRVYRVTAGAVPDDGFIEAAG